MMKYQAYILLLMSFLVMDLYGQTYIENATETNASFKNFQNKASTLQFLNSQNTEVINSTKQTAINSSNNNINIQQIGNFNTVNANTVSQSSDIDLVQNGSNNNIFLDIAATTINESITQNGNENNVLDFGSFGARSHGVEVSQKGNNHNLVSYGSNSLSEKMKISMQGQGGKTIIVRNFN